MQDHILPAATGEYEPRRPPRPIGRPGTIGANGPVRLYMGW